MCARSTKTRRRCKSTLAAGTLSRHFLCLARIYFLPLQLLSRMHRCDTSCKTQQGIPDIKVVIFYTKYWPVSMPVILYTAVIYCLGYQPPPLLPVPTMQLATESISTLHFCLTLTHPQAFSSAWLLHPSACKTASCAQDIVAWHPSQHMCTRQLPCWHLRA